MKSYKNLFEKIVSFDNLVLAAQRAQRGKRFRSEVLKFNYNLEKELLLLQDELISGTYQPGAYRTFYVYEPKCRLISAAPYRDRVVHHAICNILVPYWDKSMIPDNYACRVDKGSHRAIARFHYLAKKYPYVLKCDIRKFYDSIDHQILQEILFKHIPETRIRALLAKIIDCAGRISGLPDERDVPCERRRAGRISGLPIGNLTSQWFANLYLTGFDWFAVRQLKTGGYVRYMDDFACFARTKQELHFLRGRLAEYLAGLRLAFSPGKCNLYRTASGVNFLGFRIFPTHRKLLKHNVHRLKRRLRYFQRKLRQQKITLADIRCSLMSWLGHAQAGNARSLVAALFCW